MPLVTIADLKADCADTMDLIGEAQTLHTQYHRFLACMEDKGPKRDRGIHASEISKCYRQAVYTLRGEDKIVESSKDPEVKAYWKKTFDHGTYVHRMIQDHFLTMAKDSGPTPTEYITFQEEAKIHPDLQELAAKWDIYSSCDGVLTYHRENTPYLRVGLEIKTKKSSEFEKLKEPEPAHIEQAHVYMAALDIPLFWFIYQLAQRNLPWRINK